MGEICRGCRGLERRQGSDQGQWTDQGDPLDGEELPELLKLWSVVDRSDEGLLLMTLDRREGQRDFVW